MASGIDLGVDQGAEESIDSAIGGDGRGREKSREAFRTISEVAKHLDLPQHVLRFWETKFPQVSPMKRGGGRRYYRPEDVEVLVQIKSLLHEEGYTIKGVQKLLKKPGGVSTPNMVDKTTDALLSSEKEANSSLADGTTDGISRADAESLLNKLVAVRADLKKFS